MIFPVLLPKIGSTRGTSAAFLNPYIPGRRAKKANCELYCNLFCMKRAGDLRYISQLEGDVESSEEGDVGAERSEAMEYKPAKRWKRKPRMREDTEDEYDPLQPSSSSGIEMRSGIFGSSRTPGSAAPIVPEGGDDEEFDLAFENGIFTFRRRKKEEVDEELLENKTR